MKKQLQKKFYAFIVTAMMFSASANAQIVYTDINPDISVIRTRLAQRGHVHIEHNMDINNDNIADLKFILTSSNITAIWPKPAYTEGSVKVTPLNGSAILTGTSGNPAKMNLNASINANANWSAIANQFIISNKKSGTTTTKTGNWNTATDGFLGVRLIIGGQTHYCWIRLTAEAFSSGDNASILVIKDLAYSSIPNQPILAGETN